MLTIEGLHLSFGDFELRADITLPAGEIVAVIGPSGAGKSTLLGIIAGFQNAAGRVVWQGRDLSNLSPMQRPVTMIFQEGNLFPHLTVAQNVGMGISPALKLTPRDHQRVEQALGRVGLDGFGPRKPAQLSGGQAARVTLARALLRDRPLMLLDEPFGALGPALRKEMLALVAEIAQETEATVLMVSHDPADARQIADQVVLVADGLVHAPVPTQTLFENPPKALADYLGV